MISSTTVIIELEYWAYSFLSNNPLNKKDIPYPPKIPSEYISYDTSFIRLLFDDNWPKDLTYYNYLFSETSFNSSWPSIIRNRLCIYPSAKLYETSNNGENFFSLKDDDFLMLDKLLEFRTSDSTAEISIDSINVLNLETVLSKLIYYFLNLQVNKEYENFNDMELISNTVLTSLYELYVVEKMFTYVSSKGS